MREPSLEPESVDVDLEAWESARPRARLRWCGRALGIGAGIGLLVMLGGSGLWWWLVVVEPGPEFDRENIRDVVARESTVTYRDGTRLGVFFESEHRRYVPFDELPPAWAMAIVAVEDVRFWSHHGIDPRGIGRAIRDNLLARRVVAGGSTLTQQTAKNVFYRPDRSLRSKLVEAIDAQRLEAHFSKSEILELYANQFHVTSNGRGLGIAARHFFDVETGELTLAQCAFIAGAVKGPARYDPFSGQDESSRESAAARAHDRTRHVLGRLIDAPPEALAGPRPVSEARAVQDQARRLLAEGFELRFKRGAFRYDDSAALDEVERRLRAPPFDALLGHAGIDDPRNAGITVVTTLDPEAQRAATYGLWHHLTTVGTRMEALGPEDFVLDTSGPRFDPDREPRAHEFRTARVVEHTGARGKRELTVDLGGRPCRVERDGLAQLAAASAQGAKGNASVRVSSAEVDAWIEAIPDRSLVLASVRGRGEDGVWRCDLEVRPALQGALLALQDGELRALVGGNDNRNFNRALAPRQLGSTWKPLVYHAALRLGWSPTDPLDNRRNVFPFSGTFYYPTPDHEPAPRVSLAWAGVRSENLASVWLLFHLVDRLDNAELATIAAWTDLALRAGESREGYRERLADLGIRSTAGRAGERLFARARRELTDDPPHPDDALALQSLLYGWGLDAERKRAKTHYERVALDNDFRWLEGRRERCRAQYEALLGALRDGFWPSPADVKDLGSRLGPDGRLTLSCGTRAEGFAAMADPLAPNGIRLQQWTGRFPEQRDLWIDARLHLSTLDALAERVKQLEEATLLGPPPDPYAPEVLYANQDFRTLLALRYVARLAREYGVQSEIREVPSMVLGASDLTLEEATVLYESLVTGTRTRTAGLTASGEAGPSSSPTALIQEIRDVDGQVLYRSEARTRAVAGPKIAEMTADILRNVVLHGTGARARQAIRHGGQWLPVGGKTGTTNEYRNAAFLGFVPRPVPSGYEVRGGFVLGVYVGYDDNRPMVNRGIKLAGASGALPAWIGAADGLVQAGLLGEPPAAEPGEDGWPLVTDDDLQRIAVDLTAGLPDPEGAGRVLTRGARPVTVQTSPWQPVKPR